MSCGGGAPLLSRGSGALYTRRFPSSLFYTCSVTAYSSFLMLLTLPEVFALCCVPFVIMKNSQCIAAINFLAFDIPPPITLWNASRSPATKPLLGNMSLHWLRYLQEDSGAMLPQRGKSRVTHKVETEKRTRQALPVRDCPRTPGDGHWPKERSYTSQ